MLRLLLDEQISPVVAEQVAARQPEVPVVSFRNWEGGRHTNVGFQDAAVLAQAFEQGLTLVTYDRRTIEPLLISLAEQEQSHGGVIFVDERTIAANDFGGLVRALEELWEERGWQDWRDQTAYLQRPRSSR